MADVQELRRSPLVNRTQEMEQASGSAVSIREVRFATQVGLRAEPGTVGYAALKPHLGGLTKRVAYVVRVVESTAVLCVSPDEFLAVIEQDSQLREALTGVLGDHSGQVLDLSANRAVIEISGPAS